MIAASGRRIGWHDLPPRVRAAVEEIIGGHVTSADSQTGGFSPGTADRVRTSSGRRAFVKAVSPAQNEHSVRLARREAAITAALPANAPVPRLLGTYDESTYDEAATGWIALVFEDIDGRQPRTPWVDQELAAGLPTHSRRRRSPTSPQRPTACAPTSPAGTTWPPIRRTTSTPGPPHS